MTPLPIYALEIHASHACNLTCESCSHYSNHGMPGQMALDDAEIWFAMWSKRVNPQRFTILGGEPTLHQQLPELTEIAAKYFGHARLFQIVTNGFFLHRHPRLPDVLKRVRSHVLTVSEHANDSAYLAEFERGKQIALTWKRQGLRVDLRPSVSNWTRRYEGYGPTMEPWRGGNADMKKAWDICPAKLCAQLHKGRIWKCPRLAYLAELKAKVPDLSSAFDPFMKYDGIGINATDEELREFFGRKEESWCRMCPDERIKFNPASPIIPARQLMTKARDRLVAETYKR